MLCAESNTRLQGFFYELQPTLSTSSSECEYTWDFSKDSDYTTRKKKITIDSFGIS